MRVISVSVPDNPQLSLFVCLERDDGRQIKATVRRYDGRCHGARYVSTGRPLRGAPREAAKLAAEAAAREALHGK